MSSFDRLRSARRRQRASWALLSLFAAAVIGGCAKVPPHGTSTAVLPAPSSLPAGFSGTLPCDGCGGVAYRLTLGNAGHYILEQRYETPEADTPTNYVEVGHWTLDDAGHRLSLTPADADPVSSSRWAIAPDGNLVALDENAQPVAPIAAYTLHRQDHLDEVSFADTRWYLVNAPDVRADHSAYIRFGAQTNRLTGTTGCRRLYGDYRQDGPRLTLTRLYSAGPSCPDFVDTEQSMREALRQTRRLQVIGKYLLLFGAAGDRSPLAVFQAGNTLSPSNPY